MSLREDIRWTPVNINWFMDENQNKTGEHLTYESIDEIINKVLDAAVEAGNFLPYSEPINNRRAAYNHAINDYQEAINKLRGD